MREECPVQLLLAHPTVPEAWRTGVVPNLSHSKTSWEPVPLVFQIALGEPIFKLVKHPALSIPEWVPPANHGGSCLPQQLSGVPVTLPLHVVLTAL